MTEFDNFRANTCDMFSRATADEYIDTFNAYTLRCRSMPYDYHDIDLDNISHHVDRDDPQNVLYEVNSLPSGIIAVNPANNHIVDGIGTVNGSNRYCSYKADDYAEWLAVRHELNGKDDTYGYDTVINVRFKNGVIVIITGNKWYCLTENYEYRSLLI